MKKFIGVLLVTVMMAIVFTGCGGDSKQTSSTSNFDKSKSINVASREDGSGTRGAFIELFKIEEKDASGNKVDLTTPEASITNSTSVMMTMVASNNYSIGYISLGSLNNTVKAVKIDGAEATVANIKNKTYKISRPFNIATKENISPLAQDFINFILSKEGQAVIEKNGYISVAESSPYKGTQMSGKISIAGSSSVTPIMEKLKEAYLKIHPQVAIEIQQSDSTTGMTSAINNICDIGMASRDLKESELNKGLKNTVIALDGIAVIVNKENPTDSLTKDQVKAIFTGKTTKWSDVSK
ncbi:substrate-binding domain-containing protein [Selenomonadales bacterium OttesenSCG-928-I06]|nr:substrate-binding domain-containing protein [Selenomonadales bacterium OttesenSCG-928-I06]